MHKYTRVSEPWFQIMALSANMFEEYKVLERIEILDIFA